MFALKLLLVLLLVSSAVEEGLTGKANDCSTAITTFCLCKKNCWRTYRDCFLVASSKEKVEDCIAKRLSCVCKCSSKYDKLGKYEKPAQCK